MTKHIAFIDVETTGMRADTSEVIELGVMLGEFDQNRIVRVAEEYCEFQEPFYSIPSIITRITGINDQMVRGKTLDMDKILSILDRADGIVAHNATFDRGFVSRLLPDTLDMDWYCSVRQIKWKNYGFENGKLQQLLRAHRIDVQQAHRALDDAKNLAVLLNNSHPQLGMEETYISYLLNKNPLKKPMQSRF
ncbi:DNA polymerase III subunit epsilon [Sporosarcina sp. PTS2304]|uniref:exonuclease domain-containing protein n=1 Tax=Sporosarcina sp. PTS2304 TaxID=2283194 RepID=UPI000E0D0E7A|nr:exonuclease domain-containing protein [Sporosarcina sp. PTS2304]AXI00179.1 DNA polymerase III subunit epsilon [Sporosarcina sp. PTS2304]